MLGNCKKVCQVYLDCERILCYKHMLVMFISSVNEVNSTEAVIF